MQTSELIQLIKSSKKEAFSYVMRTHREEIYWFIRRNVLIHQDADDIVQNVFLKAWRNMESFKGNSKIRTWLYSIARNETYTFLDKKKRSATSSVEENLIGERASGYFDGDDARVRLYAALETLPERQKEVFILKYFQEKTYDEIVEIIGGSTGSHKASYHHAVKKIEDFVHTKLNLIL